MRCLSLPQGVTRVAGWSCLPLLRHSSELAPTGALCTPEHRSSSAKIEVNVYLREDFQRTNQIEHSMRKVKFLATANELSSAYEVRKLVVRRRAFLEDKEFSVFFNIPGVNLRPQNLLVDPALDLAERMRSAGANILQLYIESTPAALCASSAAPAYLRDMPDPSLSDSCTMISFFGFREVQYPKAAAELLTELWRPFRALGRVYVAKEGINAQMAIPSNVFDRFVESVQSVEYLSGLRVNVDEEVSREAFEACLPFRTLHVRPKERLVADGGIELSLHDDCIGTEMGVEEWHSRVDAADAVVIDCRNKYESDVGMFTGAIALNTDVFKESWDALEAALRGRSKDTPVMTYCTGGIRCVKTNAFIKQKLGFQNVFRLKGGIINYVKTVKSAAGGTSPLADQEPKFIGVNYVFDERVCSRVTDDVLTSCSSCGKPWDIYSNCNSTECSTRVLMCDACFPAKLGCCSNECYVSYQNFLRICNTSPVTLDKKNHGCNILSATSTVAFGGSAQGQSTGDHQPKMTFQMWRRTRADSNRITSSTSLHRAFSTSSGLSETTFVCPAIEAYCKSLSSEEPTHLRELRIETEREYPSAHHMSCGEYLGRLLASLSRLLQPARILEVGTFTGYSALCMAEGLRRGGGIVTLERDAKAARIALKHFAVSDYNIELMHGSALDSLLSLKQRDIECFDLVFIDADKNSYRSYLDIVLDTERPLLRDGGVVIVDNVLWKGAVLKHHNERPDVGTPRDADKRTQEEHKLFEKGRRMHLFNEHIRHHPNLTSLMLPFRDGLTVAQFKIKS